MSDFITFSKPHGKLSVSGCYALLFATGEGVLLGEGNTARPLRAGTLLLCAPADVLQLEAPADALRLVRFHLSVTAHPFLAPLLAPFAATPAELPATAEQAAFFDTVWADMAAISPNAPHAQQLLLARLIPLLAAITPAKESATRGEAKQGRIAPAVLAFVDAHIGEAISLDDIAGALFISKYHMSHVFKAETGLSVGEAVLRRKVEHAEALLAAGTPAHRVCELVGFNHYSAFFRIYKRIKGHSPTQY